VRPELVQRGYGRRGPGVGVARGEYRDATKFGVVRTPARSGIPPLGPHLLAGPMLPGGDRLARAQRTEVW
jgi:hypothetical protein